MLYHFPLDVHVYIRQVATSAATDVHTHTHTHTQTTTITLADACRCLFVNSDLQISIVLYSLAHQVECESK